MRREKKKRSRRYHTDIERREDEGGKKVKKEKAMVLAIVAVFPVSVCNSVPMQLSVPVHQYPAVWAFFQMVKSVDSAPKLKRSTSRPSPERRPRNAFSRYDEADSVPFSFFFRFPCPFVHMFWGNFSLFFFYFIFSPFCFHHMTSCDE